MLICLPSILEPDEVAAFRKQLLSADWEDGRKTAGNQSAGVKNNRQLPVSSPVATSLGQYILNVLGQHPQFLSAALPAKFLPPMFNRYGPGQTFGTHVDNAIRIDPQSGARLRTDLSCTLFLADPDDYEGGELVIETHYGTQSVKLDAGDLVLYPSTSLHRVEPVTRGERLAAFFWLQSMIRSDETRTLLFDLDQTIQNLGAELGQHHAATLKLTGIYHNLIRTHAEI